MTKTNLSVICVVTAWLMCATCLAADKPSLKTTTDQIELRNSKVEFSLIQLPPGKITLKDKNGKDKEFEIKPIWMGKTEVTWDEFDIYWEKLDLSERARHELAKSDDPRGKIEAPYMPPDRDWGHDGFPAGSMSCEFSKNYCIWLSKMTRHKYRLPTEAEWEYACRAGGAEVKPAREELEKLAWFSGNSKKTTHHVATKAPNAWGLYDMLGNVAEWVIKADGSEVLVGGSFQDEAENVSSNSRAAYDPAWQSQQQDPKSRWWYCSGGHVGFRVVRED